MKIVEKNGLKILIPKYGYALRNKNSGDIFLGKIYLGKFASSEDYEEVENRKADMSLTSALDDIDIKEKSLTKIGKIVANEVKDDQIALSIMEFYDEWTEGVNLDVDKYVQYKGKLYKIIQTHKTQANWTPDITPSLYIVIDKEHTGEINDPIPWTTNMECFEGKYYIEDDVIYLCIRDSGVALHHEIKNLIGSYFQTV